MDHLLIETEPKEELYSTLKIADEMMLSRSSEPVTVEMWCDRDALGPVSDFDKTPALLYLAEQVEVWPPSLLTVRVSYQHRARGRRGAALPTRDRRSGHKARCHTDGRGRARRAAGQHRQVRALKTTTHPRGATRRARGIYWSSSGGPR